MMDLFKIVFQMEAHTIVNRNSERIPRSLLRG